MIWTSAEKIKRYPYRTARTTKVVFCLEFNRDSSIQELQEELARSCNARPDNHECYELILSEGRTIYLQFSDGIMYLGLSVELGNW